MDLMTMTPEMSALKTRLKSTWESGDYGVFAKYLEKGTLSDFGKLIRVVQLFDPGSSGMYMAYFN